MSLFDPEFYPTPDAVIAKMIEPYADILSTATILEPSAGSGAIVDYITTKGLKVPYTTKRGETLMMNVTAKKEKIYTCEHNPELQLILQGKGYRIVADDFLSYRPDTRFNLVLLNRHSRLAHGTFSMPGTSSRAVTSPAFSTQRPSGTSARRNASGSRPSSPKTAASSTSVRSSARPTTRRTSMSPS